MTEGIVPLDGKDYTYEHPVLENVSDPEDWLDARLLLGEQRAQFVAWLVKAGLKGEALDVLRGQLKMFADMRDDCYTLGRYWWADPEVKGSHDRYDREAERLRAEIERLEGRE